MLTKGIEVMKYVRASAGRAGISIVFEDVNQPRHDGKTIYLPRITYKTTDLELKELMTSVDHEVAHDRFSSFEVLKEKAVDPKGILLFMWNFLEDSRINNIEAKEYTGFRENWDECTSGLVGKILSKANKDVSTISKVTTALLCWEAEVSASNFPKIQLVASTVVPDARIMDVLNNFSGDLVSCHSILDKRLGTTATYELAIKILEELGEKVSLKKIKVKTEDADATEKLDAKSGIVTEVESKAESKKGTKEEDKPSSEKRKPKEEEDEYKIVNLVLSEEDLAKYSITMPDEGSDMGKVGINFEPIKTSSGWDLTDFEKFIIVDYPRQTGPERFFIKSSVRQLEKEYATRVQPNLVSQENFAQQVRRLIQIKAKVQTQYGVKKGKLDQSRLSRICFNAPGFNERVFKNKIENKTLDAAISVLVDMSGSMSGEKLLYALASTLLVNEVCSTLNIPVEIVGFTDAKDNLGADQPAMLIYKSFQDLKVSEENIKEYFSSSSRYMSGNPDGENILWAHDRLLKRKERKKVLIVMSDGSPAASKCSSGLGIFTEKVIREIEQGKVVDIYGLGLCSDSVKGYYKANSVVNDPSEIPSKLIELIERKIINVH
jgi:cobalamin biosynthesis protein CobT